MSGNGGVGGGADHGSGGSGGGGDGHGGLKDPGFHEESCLLKPKPLPSGPPTAPKQLYNWRPATGASNVMVTPVVGPIVSAKPSIVFVAFEGHYIGADNKIKAASVVAIDGATGAHQWTSPLKAYLLRSAAIGDVDGDGMNEVVVLGYDEYLYALNGKDGSVKWKSSKTTTLSGAGPQIHDIGGDGNIEVVTNGGIFAGKSGQALSIAGLEGEIMAATILGHGSVLIMGKGVRDPAGKSLCNFATPIANLAYAQMRESENFSTIIGQSGNKLIGYNGRTCAQIFAATMPTEGGGPINIADFDGDLELEFGLAGKELYVAFETDGKVKWTKTTKDVSSSRTGSTTFDLNGDGKAEVLYADEHNLHVYSGIDGTIIYQIANTSGTLTEYPVVADVDGDGQANIVIAANNYTTFGVQAGIRVFAAPDNSWVGTRPIWNQHAYNVFNVADNGGFGAKPTDPWQKWVRKPHLLGFRNNVAMLPLRDEAECQPTN